MASQLWLVLPTLHEKKNLFIDKVKKNSPDI